MRLSGERLGDDAIARQLGCTRHRVRKVLMETASARASNKGVAQVKDIPIDQVLILAGRRLTVAEKVASMAESIDHSGLIHPITVRETTHSTVFILVAGRHRLDAFRRLGRDRIPALVMPAATTEVEARTAEIAENLHRAELTALQRNQQIAEWRELAKVRKNSAPSNHQPNETGNRETARDLGIDEKAVRNAVKIASITPEAAEAARTDDDSQSKLLEVAAAAPEHQVETVHKVAGARAIMASRVEPKDSLDFFATPPWSTRALMERVFPHLNIVPSGTFWEPAAGEGHMSGVLAEYARVHASDIHDYGQHLDQVVDFLDLTGKAPEADWIITNPPFGDKTVPFVLRALDLAHVGVAMFVRLQWLEGIERYESIFRDHPPTFVCPFVERVNLCKGRWDPDGTTATAYAWLVWMKHRAPTLGQSQMFWIAPGCREALSRPNDRSWYAPWPGGAVPHPRGR
jgi:ParB/RepB/Spo0J family partition protein